MKFRNLIITLFLTTSVLFSANAISGDLEIAQKALKKAHEAFLNKKYKKVSVQLKKVLKHSNGNKVIESNAFELLNAAHKELGQMKMPADWDLPKEISFMKIGFRRQHNEIAKYTGFKIDVVGLIQKPSNLEQLKIVKYPNRVIIDKRRSVGSFDAWKHDGDNGVYLGRRFEKINFDGLYLIEVKLKGQESTHGWFISSSMKSSETPVITSPLDGGVFQTGNPELKWNNFFSPEYQSFEQRKLDVKVTNFDLKRETVWKLDEHTPKRESAIVGREGTGVSFLPVGSYLLHVNYGERQKFGPLKLSRDSRAVTGFEVK